MTQGYEWDVWPRDTSALRVALGITQTVDAAKKTVEKMLAARDDALFGTVDHFPGPQWLCRRGYAPGSYVWQERPRQPPA